MNDKRTVDQARKQLGEFNQEDKPLEWCVQDMRLASERLKKNVVDANQEIAVTNNLVDRQSNALTRQRKEINELKAELE